MRKRLAVSALIVMLSLWSTAHAFDGGRRRGSGDGCSRQELLSKLSADKEMLFHQTMREAGDKAFAMRTQIKELREDIKEILTADQFDEDLFREKTNSLETLQSKMHATMEEAVVKLAKQFTADERKILVQLLPRKLGHGRHSPGRRHQ